MSEPHVRGYMIATPLKYIDVALRPDERDQVIKALGAPAYEAMRYRSPIEWCPVSEFNQIFRSIGTLAQTDEDGLNRFIDVGKFISHEATNTFLRIFMRLMTPNVFAGRLPTLFKRDVQGDAHVTIERIGGGEIVARFRDVKDFDHVASVGVGWIAFALENMGKKIVGRKCEGWSLKEPGPPEATVTVRWRD